MLEFLRVQNPKELMDVQKLRYQVYCHEKHFLPAEDYPNGIEADEFDQNSVHFLAMENDGDGEILGTMRLILDSERGFPVEKHFELSRPIKDRSKTVELSRLIVAKEARHLTVHILMGLSKEVYLYSKEFDTEDCYAVLEDPLLRLLTRFGLPFEPAGKKCWYMGAQTAPNYLSIQYAEQVLEQNNALFFAYLHESKESIVEI